MRIFLKLSSFLTVSFLLLVFPFPASSGTDRSGDNEVELTQDFECVSDFSWSPDGKNIAFSSNYNVYIQEICP